MVCHQQVYSTKLYCSAKEVVHSCFHFLPQSKGNLFDNELKFEPIPPMNDTCAGIVSLLLFPDGLSSNNAIVTKNIIKFDGVPKLKKHKKH